MRTPKSCGYTDPLALASQLSRMRHTIAEWCKYTQLLVASFFSRSDPSQNMPLIFSPDVRSSTFPSHSMPVYYGSYPLALRSMNHTFRMMTSDSFSVINSKKSSQHIAFERIFLWSDLQWRSWRNLSDDRPANSYTHPRSSTMSTVSIRHKHQDRLDVVPWAISERRALEKTCSRCVRKMKSICTWLGQPLQNMNLSNLSELE